MDLGTTICNINIDYIKDQIMKSITVLGCGESGVGTALLAKKNGIDVWVSDFGKIKEAFKEELILNDIPFEENGHSFSKIEMTDIIVKSPGIPESAKVIQYFRLRKKIISEIEFAYPYYNGKLIAITGSNGKTTTATLTFNLIKQGNLNVGLGGNIGYSFARMVYEDKGYDWVVLELSSFQLDDIYDIKFEIGAILNITPDHLDRYDYDFNNYAKAKWKLASNVKDSGLLILNSDDETLRSMFDNNQLKSKTCWLSSLNPPSLTSDQDKNNLNFKLYGKHNLFNANVAKEIATYLDVSNSDIVEGLNNSESIEHRLERVGEFNQIVFINDSKATNVESAEVALDSFEDIIWIAGGVDKGNDYSSIKGLVGENVKALICLGENDKKLRESFDKILKKIKTVKSMKEALEQSVGIANPGDVILLSPACASFDLYENYIDRGNTFKKEFTNLLNGISK